MDYSAANTELWSAVLQIGLIAVAVLFAGILCRRFGFFRRSLVPPAVLAGFILLLLRTIGLVDLDLELLEAITYHCIAIGFIAMSLKVSEEGGQGRRELTGVKSGALIVSVYLLQAIIGIVISFTLAVTVMPGLFKASGVLLPMGFGQGPGQANNIGGTYEALGFSGGRSFGLSLAAAGYIIACVAGVIMVNILTHRGRLRPRTVDDSSDAVTVEAFQSRKEPPLSESLDKFTVQAALVAGSYLLTYLLILGVTSLISALSPELGDTVSSLLWGFNFVIGSVVALLVNSVLGGLRRRGIMERQYQNNYLLSRISGLAFDFMIVAGIASIEIGNLAGLWLPFLLMCVFGGVLTWVYLAWLCRRIYPDYSYEGLLSMFGMLTGTVSSGVLLLREIDPECKTPAANNLVVGSAFAIVFGAPMLLLVGLAPKSDTLLLVVLGICIVYFALLVLLMLKLRRRGGTGARPARKTNAEENGNEQNRV